MYQKLILFLLLSIGYLIPIKGQNFITKQLHFKGLSSNSEGYRYYLNDSSTVTFTKFSFYISSICFFDGNKKVYEELNSYHLINLLNNDTLHCVLPKNLVFTSIKFHIGVDSTTSVNGAMDGDLDPTKGMYWTWQSGYINIMLEGHCSKCATRKNEFFHHIGGYQYPTNALQTLSLPINSTEFESVEVQFNLSQWMSLVDIAKNPNIMSPSPEAKKMSLIFSECLELVK
jgi:hypothetical protein